ncbi:MAG: WD40 repeat domain-containing protein [Gemmatimonadetes bacterium]|jgi:WD40 repeat protein|nr:WD40 repeat domain-containing protein [Gemmatimonadota bacterium]
MAEAKEKSKRGATQILGGLLNAVGSHMASTSPRRLLRQIVAALVAGQGGFLVFGLSAHSAIVAVAFLLLGMGAGVAAVSVGSGIVGWMLLWMLNGLGYGLGLGSWEGAFYALVWSIPGIFLSLFWALFLWTRIERLHEANAQRLVNGFLGMAITPVLFALPLGIMGLLDLGWSDDVIGVMAMGGIAGCLFGLIAGLGSVDVGEVGCPSCGADNRVSVGRKLERSTCRICHDFLENPASAAKELRGEEGVEQEVKPPTLRRSIAGLLWGMIVGAVVQTIICIPCGVLFGWFKGELFARIAGFPVWPGAVDGAIQGGIIGGVIGAISGMLSAALDRGTSYLRILPSRRAVGCSTCGVENRVDRGQEVEGIHCRSCGNPLSLGRQWPRWIWGLGLTFVSLLVLLAKDISDRDRELFTLRGHDYWVESLAFSPDGKHLASGGDDEMVLIWDLDTGEEVDRFHAYYDVHQVAFSADGRHLAWGLGDPYTSWQEDNNKIGLYEVEAGEIIERLEGHRSAVTGVAFSADGRRLVSAGADSTVRIWDAESWQREKVIDVEDSAWRMALAANGRTLAIDGPENSVEIRDLESGRVIHVLKGHSGGTKCLAFSPDGRYLASGGLDYKVKMWEVESGGLKWEAGGLRYSWSTEEREGHRGYVLALVFSSDGRYLASGGEYRTVRLWEAETGTQVRVFGGAEPPFTLIRGGHPDGVQALAFSPDGRYLASADEDGLIKFWRME